MVDPELEGWRKKIDEIDYELLLKLFERKKVSSKVMRWKEKYHVPLLDQEREEKLLTKLQQKGAELHLDERFIAKLYRVILEDAKSS